MQLKILPADFYQQDTTQIAQELIGKILVANIHNQKYNFKIVETEAYLGLADPAAHSFHGKKTPRVLPMYQMGGTIYVYLIYGLYWCLNIVTKPEGIPEAVLIRGLEPLAEFPKATNGPGRIGMALELSLSLNGQQVFNQNSPIQIYEDLSASKYNIAASPRVGIDRHTEARTWPLRFFIPENSFVSKGKYFLPKNRPLEVGKGGNVKNNNNQQQNKADNNGGRQSGAKSQSDSKRQGQQQGQQTQKQGQQPKQFGETTPTGRNTAMNKANINKR
jgi:DNA-3-methyladenine glycosylase